MNPQEDKLSRFVYDKADWDEFSRLCENLVVDNYVNLADPSTSFSTETCIGSDTFGTTLATISSTALRKSDVLILSFHVWYNINLKMIAFNIAMR